MTVQYDVVIVGGGHGGAQTAISLRQQGFEGSIAIFTDEPDLPYERPPLTKQYLAGSKSFEDILIRPEHFWLEREITIWKNERIRSVDADARRVITQRGNVIRYGDLVWAAGGVPKRLSCVGHDLKGVHFVRNRADADRLVSELPESDRIVVIGGGYIGLETAATLTELGKRVTIVQIQNRLLSRVSGLIVSHFLQGEHECRGVDIRLSAAVAYIEANSDHACAVRLVDGERLIADQIIVGIGIEPSVEPLRQIGAHGDNGVMVDEVGRTSLPHVYAVGDCALHNNPFAPEMPVRLESVQNAVEMGAIVAGALCGNDTQQRNVPWFWSHQYKHRLQTVGVCTEYDKEILHGDPTNHRFSVAYLRRRKIIAVDCVNDPKTFVEARMLFASDTDALDARFSIGHHEVLGPSASEDADVERPFRYQGT